MIDDTQCWPLYICGKNTWLSTEFIFPLVFKDVCLRFFSVLHRLLFSIFYVNLMFYFIIHPCQLNSINVNCNLIK